MTPEMSFRSDVGERSHLRRWLLIGLVASLALHFALGIAFMFTKLERFGTYTERLAPRPFTVKRVDIDAALLEEPAQAPERDTPKKADEVPDIILPAEETFDQILQDVRATPAAPESVKPLVTEQPRPDAETLQIAERLREDAARELEESLGAVNAEISAERPMIDSGMGLSEDGPQGTSSSAMDVLGSGYSDIDGLLAQTGELKAGTAPILMPTDLLFDYNSADMRPAAIRSLQKLGKLISRNPNTLFVIEGHTDSFGPPAYNMELSRQRAESVKRWVVQTMDIDPAQIRTRGYGSTQLIAPATGSIEEQQINRRVEIVIQANE